MSGKVTSLEGVTPKPRKLEVVSYELSPLYLQGERYNPDDLVGRRGLTVYKKMLIDEQVRAVVQFKRDAITSRGWTFSFDKDSPLSDDERAARIAVYEAAARRMQGSFEDALNAVARGRSFGYSLTEKVFDTIDVGGKAYMGLHSLIAREPSTFVFFTDPFGTLQKVEQRMAGVQQEVDLNKFVHYVHNPEEDRYYGQSDLRQAYRAWYAKDQLTKLYLTYMERFAGGFAVFAIDKDSDITSDSPEYASMKATLQNLRAISGVIVPRGVSFKIESPASTDEYREALTFYDLAIAKALLVPNLLGLSHSGQTGAYAQSQTQLEAFFWTLNSDARRLEACINEQLFDDLGDLNWGDNEYPSFHFKPASQEHVRWLVSTWKDLVGAKAVQPTEEDEEHLRKLLEMPQKPKEEDTTTDSTEVAVPSDPSAAFAGQQITALLDIIQRVGEGKLPKEAAVQVLQQSFPISEEDARKMLDSIEEGSLKPEPGKDINGNPLPGFGPDGKQLPPAAAEPVARVPGKPPLAAVPAKSLAVAATHNHKPIVASVAAFTSATQRVDFSVIEHAHRLLSRATTDDTSRLIARAAWRVLGNSERVNELLTTDVADIEHVAFDGADIGKIKAALKAGLNRAWVVGSDQATRELRRAEPVKFATLPTATAKKKGLRDTAADYFESNGYRMAANLSDGARSIIALELQSGVKQGLTVDSVVTRIFERLIAKGYTTLDDVAAESGSTVLVDALGNALVSAAGDTLAYLSTLVRTNTFEALNEARYAEFTDPALDGFVVAFEYSAILDNVTTEICQSLDGAQYSADNPIWAAYTPPNHYNCRSLLIPITAIDGWDKEKDEDPNPDVLPQEGFR